MAGDKITIKQYVDMSIKPLREDINRLEGKFDAFICSADKKYAPRWVVNVLAWAGITLVGLLVSIVGFFINKNML